jgi:hypothetical protein
MKDRNWVLRFTLLRHKSYACYLIRICVLFFYFWVFSWQLVVDNIMILSFMSQCGSGLCIRFYVPAGIVVLFLCWVVALHLLLKAVKLWNLHAADRFMICVNWHYESLCFPFCIVSAREIWTTRKRAYLEAESLIRRMEKLLLLQSIAMCPLVEVAYS